ncbi:(2Fe-2S)-binding protein [Streptomyces sp. bgisy100]|uniref:(2Fe-2S)-binding protein n=1 Tax=Streptomyces sp. bgisy100 TaxID=3413783 RepID=UPI003D7571F1
MSAPAPEAAAHGPRYALGHVSQATGPDLLPADRLLDPGSPELDRLLTGEYEGSGHRTAHAAALTLIAVYAGRVTAAAVLQWALDGRVPDLRAENVLVRPSGHGIGGVWLRRNRMLTGAATAVLPATADRPGAVSAEATPATPCGHVQATAGDRAPARPRPDSSPCPACFRAATLPLLHRAVLDEHLLPLADALHRRTRAGLRQLRGGVAHGCATALCASQADPSELALRWDEFSATAPGGIGHLGEVARVRRPDGTPRLVYLRRTCCLYYTSAEAVRCASCCLTGRAERLRAYAARA